MKIQQFSIHFQREISFLFQRIPKPQFISQDFLFKLPDQVEQCDFLPQITEIHLDDNHIYFVLNNCLEGQIFNHKIDPSRVFYQVFKIFDSYYKAFQENKIGDRDFNQNRLFLSGEQLCLIDFGFVYMQKQLPRLQWTAKLANLLNQIYQNPNCVKNGKASQLVNKLLYNKIIWDDIEQLIQSTFEFTQFDFEPQEFKLYRPCRSQADGQRRSENNAKVMQSRIIRLGSNNIQDHFERIKKSFSPGLSRKLNMTYDNRPSMSPNSYQGSKSIYQGSKQNSSFNGHFSNGSRQIHVAQNIVQNKVENQFEYKVKQESKERVNLNQRKQYPTPLTIRPQSHKNTIEQDNNATYLPTLLEKGNQQQPITQTMREQGRPATSKPPKQEDEQNFKSLLRSSTKELQQTPKSRKSQQQRNPQQQVNIHLQSLNLNESLTNDYQFQLKRPPSSRAARRRKSSDSSIQNIEQVVQQIKQEQTDKPAVQTLQKPKQSLFKRKESVEIKQEIKEEQQQQIKPLEQTQRNNQIDNQQSQMNIESIQLQSNQHIIKPPLQINIQEIPSLNRNKNDEECFMMYDNQLKLFDLIGILVGKCIHLFNAKKNYWILPLFLCFKRMYFLRKQFQSDFDMKVNIFNCDMNIVNNSMKIQDLATKMKNNSIIVYNEVEQVLKMCQAQIKKMDAKETQKIEKFINMDEKPDVQDVYFLYLYTQIFKTIKGQYSKVEDDPQKCFDNLKLQLIAISCVIISEKVYETHPKYINLKQYNTIQKSQNKEEFINYINQNYLNVCQMCRTLQQYTGISDFFNHFFQDPAQYYFHQKMQGLFVRLETLKALCNKEAEIPKIVEHEQNQQVIDRAAIQRRIGIIGTINQNIQNSNQEEVVQILFEQVEQQQQKVEQELKYQGTTFQTRLEQRRLTRQSTQRVANSNVNSRQKLETYSNNTPTPVSLKQLDDPKLNSDDVKKSETASQPETSQFADQNLGDILLPNGLDEIREDHTDEAQQSIDIRVDQDSQPVEIKQDEPNKEDEQKEQINKEEQIIKIDDAYENPIQDKDIEEAITE